MDNKEKTIKEYFRERTRKEREKFRQFTATVDREIAEPFLEILKEKGISYRQWLKDKMEKELQEMRGK